MMGNPDYGYGSQGLDAYGNREPLVGEYGHGSESLGSGNHGLHEGHVQSGTHFDFHNTEHTRSDYKVVIAGREFDFLKDDLSPDVKARLAEEAQNICIDISSDESLKDCLSSFMRVLKSSTEMEVEKPELSPEATQALESSKRNLKSIMDNMTQGYDFARLEKAWCTFRKRSAANEQVQTDWVEFFNFLK